MRAAAGISLAILMLLASPANAGKLANIKARIKGAVQRVFHARRVNQPPASKQPQKPSVSLGENHVHMAGSAVPIPARGVDKLVFFDKQSNNRRHLSVDLQIQNGNLTQTRTVEIAAKKPTVTPTKAAVDAKPHKPVQSEIGRARQFLYERDHGRSAPFGLYP